MKILFITHVAPAASGIGVQQRCRNHIAALSTLGEVVVLRVAETGVVADSDTVDQHRGVSTVALAYQPVGAGSGRWGPFRLALAWESRYRYTYPATQLQAVRHALAAGRFDLVMCFRLPSYLLARALGLTGAGRQAKLLVDFDDIESTAQVQRLRQNWHRLGMAASAARLVTALRTRRLEAEIMAGVDAVAVCTERDRRRLTGHAALPLVLPNVYPDPGDIPWPARTGTLRLLFVGALAYPPNRDAIFFFIEEILPLLRERLRRPFAIDVVGGGASERLVRAAKAAPEVALAGHVPSVRPFYATASIVLVPLRSGGGTRIKILEAMAYSRAIVTTTAGAEGLGLAQGRRP